MGTRVASIYADIGLDASKFSKGSRDIIQGLESIFGSFGKFGGVLAVSGAAIGVVVDQVAKATTETQNYNLSMVDLARKMGTTTEEASKLVQVGDDLRLSQEQISTAMTYAIRNGVEPNIEGLAKLADKYNSLNTPVEKGQLLLKTFGRSGMEMGKLLEQGSDGLRSMSEAIDDNLIVTYDAARASEEFYEKQDNLMDQWQGIKMQVGNDVIPALSDLIDYMNAYSEAAEKGGFLRLAPVAAIAALIDVNKELSEETENVTYSTEQLTKKFNDVETASYSAADSYTASAEELAEMNDVNKTTIGMIEKFTDLTGLSAEEHDKATKKIMLGYMEQQLAVGGLTTAEADALIAQGVAWGVYSETAVIEMKKAMDEANSLITKINEIPSEKTITIRTYYTANEMYRTNDYHIEGVTGRASGGSAGGMTLVGERGPELLNLPNGSSITDANQTKSMLGGTDPALARTLSTLDSRLQSLPGDLARAMRQDEKLGRR